MEGIALDIKNDALYFHQPVPLGGSQRFGRKNCLTAGFQLILIFFLTIDVRTHDANETGYCAFAHLMSNCKKYNSRGGYLSTKFSGEIYD